MKILVLNCGSSSIKYQLFDMDTKGVLSKGVIEKIGMKDSFMKHKNKEGEAFRFEEYIADHIAGIEFVLEKLLCESCGSISSLDEIGAVGHRIVHGGQKFSESALITDKILEEIKEVTPLAPLHNPHNLKGVTAITKRMPDVPQVAVFDTAFHQTMPDYAYMYAIPYEYYEKYGYRRYGFHGTSHRFLALRTAKILNKKPEDLKIITCHLGNGGSVCAIKHGESVDTSMGLTPAEGLIMGTRCGDIDPAIIVEIIKRENKSAEELSDFINKESGVWGVSGVSSDMRDVEIEAWEHNNKRADLALEMYFYRIKKYIGAYAAAMNGVDAIVFAGGVGENGPETREAICEGLGYLGVEFNKKINDGVKGKELDLSMPGSKVKVLCVPTDEELMIAQDTLDIVKG